MTEAPPTRRRPVGAAVKRGLANRCPGCGDGALLRGYLEPHTQCPACGAPNGDIKAQDAPPYLTIVIVGHIVVPLLLVAEQTLAPPTWVHLVVWLPVTLALTLALLPRVKGAWMGFMWALGLTGSERQ